MVRRMVRGAEGVTVSLAGSTFTLSGQIATAADAAHAEAVVRGYAGDLREVTNNLRLLSSI